MSQDENVEAGGPLDAPLNWGAIRRDAWKSTWSATNRRAGLLCLPVIAAWVFVGIVSGEHDEAVRAVAGAVAVGFGAFQHLGRRRTRSMAITLIGMSAATWLGCVAGYAGVVPLVVTIAFCAYAFGAMSMLGFGAWWIGLQWMIALLVYGSRSAPPTTAAVVALFVAAGGASQWLFLTLLLPLTDHWFSRNDKPVLDVKGPVMRALAANLNPSTSAGRYAVRVAAALTVAAVINHLIKMPNGYWAPMTATILIRPDRHDTYVRTLSRVMGTLLGAGLTTLLVALVRPDRPTLGIMLLAAVWACYALQRVNYGVFSMCITTYVVLLLSALGLPEPDVALHRVLATLLGAAVALAVHLPSLQRREEIEPPSHEGAKKEARAGIA